MKFVHYSYKGKKSHKSTLEGAVSHYFYVMDDICLIGTHGKQPGTKTMRQDSLFTSKHSEIAMMSETCVEPTQWGIFNAGKIRFFISICYRSKLFLGYSIFKLVYFFQTRSISLNLGQFVST